VTADNTVDALAAELGCWTEERLAEFLGCDLRTLQQKRYRRDGPRFVKVGTRVLYRVDDLREWLEANAVEPTGRDVEVSL
jgi:hypothetical protein